MMTKNPQLYGLKCGLMRKLHTGIGSTEIKGFTSYACYGTSSGSGGIMPVLRDNSLGMGKATKLYLIL